MLGSEHKSSPIEPCARTENPRVGGSIPPLGTIFSSIKSMICDEFALWRYVPIFGLGFVLGLGSDRMKTAKDAKLGSPSLAFIRPVTLIVKPGGNQRPPFKP